MEQVKGQSKMKSNELMTKASLKWIHLATSIFVWCFATQIGAQVEQKKIETKTETPKKTEKVKLENAFDCNDVDVQELRSLQFGLLRIRAGTGGWAIVDAGGGVKTSPGIAFSHRFPPSVGAVQVTSSPNTEVTLAIELIGNSSAGPITMTQPMAVNETGMYGLKRSGKFWVLRMPNSDKTTVSVDVAIGGQLIVQSVDKRWDLKTKIVAQCVGVRAVSPP